MNRFIRPHDVGAPSANYELAVLSSVASSASSRQLFTSGIGPTRPDGSVPDTIQAQAQVIWSTLTSILAEADLEYSDIVQVTTYVVVPDAADSHLDSGEGTALSNRLVAAMNARDSALDGHRCASVLVPVPALATTTWKMEVALVAISAA